MPLLGNCCFFLDLKVGTLIIGIICLISGLINTLSWAIASVAISFASAGTNAAEDVVKSIHSSSSGGGFSGFEEDDEYADVSDVKEPDAMAVMLEWFNNHMNTAKIICFFLLALSLTLVIVASMLIHGVKRNRRGLLFPWIILESVKAVVLLILGITVLAIFGGIDIIIYTALTFFIGVGLEIYFILVVVSQYQALGIIRMHDEHALDMK